MPSPLPARRGALADASGEDEEATEFLSVRPTSKASPPRHPGPSGEAVPRAQGRAVPIEGEAPPQVPSLASLPTTAPESVRPLPNKTIGTDLSATGTSSVPRVTRILVPRGGSTTNREEQDSAAHTDDDVDATIPPEVLVKAPPRPASRVSTRVDARYDETQAGEDGDDDTQALSARGAAPAAQPPPPRALPRSAEGEPALAAPRQKQMPRGPVAAEVYDGVLVVDAPAEATVIVNGVERGRGTVKVDELDRDARHAVRIHCPGFAPWSGSVSLQGKPAAKIRPALKPRAR